MKKLLASLLSIVMTATVVATPLSENLSNKVVNTSISAHAGGNTEFEYYNDFKYYNNDGIVISEYLGDSDDVVIPSEINGKKVKSIGYHAFFDCSSLKSVTIPNSVTSIGNSAFENCSSLTSVTIPNSVTSIGWEAFYDTPFLVNQTTDVKYAGNWVIDCDYEAKYVSIKSGTVGIADCAFYGCENLTSVTIPNSVTSIGDDAFSYCESLKSVTIPNSVTSIGYCAFEGCTSLTSITIPNSVTSIGDSAFFDCGNLTSVTIPNSVKSIGSGAFYGTPFLVNQTTDVKYAGNWVIDCDYEAKYVSIKSGTVGIADCAFNGCSSLTNVTIPNSVTIIGGEAFADCSSLTNITIPNRVTSIGYRAFSFCESLKSVAIPNSVSSIGDWAFYKCTSLTSITVDSNNKNYSSQDGVLFDKNKTELIQYPIGNTRTSYTIPNSVTRIGNGAFEYCTSLTSVTIPDSVTSIGYEAFLRCESLTSVTIPKSVEDIGYNSFGYGYDSEFSEYYKINDFKIYCYKDTAGEEYAIDNGFDYELLDAPAHTHSYTSKVTKQPTCTATGVKTFTCDCGDSYNETIKATGHKFGSWTTTKKATCKSTGTQTRKCSTCGKIETKTIAKKSHSYKNVSVNSTYFAKGYTGKKCSVCGTITGKKDKALLTMATPKASANNTTSLKLSWSKVKDAKGYDVYQLKGKKWSKIKTTSGTSYTVPKLKSGTNYKFYVKPYTKSGSKTVYGNQSKTLTTSTKSSAVSLKVTAGKKKASLSWKKVTGATNYVVYYKTSAKGKWVKLKSANNKTTSYTKTKLTSKKTYWFKVDTVRKVSGKTYTTTGYTKSIKIK